MSYLGDSPKFSTFPSQRFSGDGSTTSFTLQQSTPSPASLIVTIDGVKQQAASYAVTGTSLDFNPGVPASGSNLPVSNAFSDPPRNRQIPDINGRKQPKYKGFWAFIIWSTLFMVGSMLFSYNPLFK